MKQVEGWKGFRKWKSENGSNRVEGDKKWIIEKESVSKESRFYSGLKQNKMHEILTWMLADMYVLLRNIAQRMLVSNNTYLVTSRRFVPAVIWYQTFLCFLRMCYLGFGSFQQKLF